MGGQFHFKLAELLKYGTEADFYTMTMMVVMNKRKYDSLPDDVKKVIDETTGLVMSEEAGRVYDEVRPVMKKLCEKKGMQAIQMAPGEIDRLKKICLPSEGGMGRTIWKKEVFPERPCWMPR